jgi:CRISPR-associated endonuclease Cas3-HD
MAQEPTTYFAHSQNAAGRKHPLAEHLRSVAELAARYAGEAPCSDEARLAGLLHDLGKYGDLFQARLRGEVSGLDHWSQGAFVALRDLHSIAAALAIQGHHIGLQNGDLDSLKSLLKHHQKLRLTLSDHDLDRLKSRLQADELALPPPRASAPAPLNNIAAMLDVRLLFSCLTDADFLDTEAHFNGDEQGKHYRDAGPKLDHGGSLAALERYMGHVSRGQPRGRGGPRGAGKPVDGDAAGRRSRTRIIYADRANRLGQNASHAALRAAPRGALESAAHHHRNSLPYDNRADRAYLPGGPSKDFLGVSSWSTIASRDSAKNTPKPTRKAEKEKRSASGGFWRKTGMRRSFSPRMCSCWSRFFRTAPLPAANCTA